MSISHSVVSQPQLEEMVVDVVFFSLLRDEIFL